MMGSRKVYEVTITSKGQMVIPKQLREQYNLKRGTRVRVIVGGDGLLIKPSSEGPWVGLRGMMKDVWGDADLDKLIGEAKRSLFKVKHLHGRNIRR
jgi:AbrB family looped-hinge helix DNA binding protein